MASNQRIEDLKRFCGQWKEQLQGFEKRRNELLDWQSAGVNLFDGNGNALLPTLISEADDAVRQFSTILTRMESALDRAIAGEDL